MKVHFWGVRGSIPAPGPHTFRYGGNTTCIEVRSDDNSLIILDAGTGIFPLAQELLKQMPVQAHVFITHTHWDHIHGLPFFTQLFIPGNSVRIHGGYDVVAGRGIDQIMEVQLQYSYFPVREAEMKARIEYETLSIGEPVQVGDATVTPFLLNHPVVDFGYRVACNGKSVFFTGDHEPWSNMYSPEDEGYAEFQQMVETQQGQLDQALAASLSRSGLLGQAGQPQTPAVTTIGVDQVIADGDVIQLGDWSWTVLATPGHSDCSISLYDADRRVLVISDATGYYMPATAGGAEQGSRWPTYCSPSRRYAPARGRLRQQTPWSPN